MRFISSSARGDNVIGVRQPSDVFRGLDGGNQVLTARAVQRQSGINVLDGGLQSGILVLQRLSLGCLSFAILSLRLDSAFPPRLRDFGLGSC